MQSACVGSTVRLISQKLLWAMDKFACMQAFTQVVEAGGYAAAAREMGLSRSQVNKLVTQLEASLGVTLLQRTTRHVTPTTTGQAFYQRCLEILAALGEAEQAMTQLHHEPKGRLRINAPLSFGIALNRYVRTLYYQ